MDVVFGLIPSSLAKHSCSIQSKAKDFPHLCKVRMLIRGEEESVKKEKSQCELKPFKVVDHRHLLLREVINLWVLNLIALTLFAHQT